MTRRFRRLALVAGALALPILTSGCAVLQQAGFGGVVGAPSQRVRICASGPLGPNSNYRCPDKGNLKLDATTGFRQLLVGARIPAGVGVPATITTESPQSITFTASPGYAAELQRLDPAPAGQQWVGWISPSLNYDTSVNTPLGQTALVVASLQLPHAADGSPWSAGSITAHWVVGIRNVTQAALPDRAVTCGDSLTTAVRDTDSAVPDFVGFTYCLDSGLDVTSPASDYGVVTSGARATGAPGSLLTMPFIVRSGGVDPGTDLLPVSAATTLPRATIALPQTSIPAPPKNGDTTALVAVGIPADAAPGTYDVTFTADIGGQTRSGAGRLTVLAPPATGSGAPVRRKLTTVLPKGLSVTDARASGLKVLVGSTVAGRATVRLRQGRGRRALSLAKTVRLKAPGPVKVTFRSRRLVAGSFRVTITVSGKVVARATGRLAPAR